MHSAAAPITTDLYPSSGPLSNPFARSGTDPNLATSSAYLRWLLRQPDLMAYVADCVNGTTEPTPDEQALIDSFANGDLPLDHHRPIFVFGSNQAGIHGAGAARYAATHHAAEHGVGQGPTGHAYAIPTKNAALKPLRHDEVIQGLDTFFAWARNQPEQSCRLTRVGCGLAGLDETTLRDHCLRHAPASVELPGVWAQQRNASLQRIIVTGSRAFSDRTRVWSILNKTIDKIGAFEVISGGNEGVDHFGEQFAARHHLALRRFPARWDLAGDQAGLLRNELMAWYATHLIAFQKDSSAGTGHMIKAARRAGLKVHVVSA